VSEPRATILLAIYIIVLGYYAAALFAAWLRPELQIRFPLLKPRWRWGYSASSIGMTSQAIFAVSMGIFIASRAADSPQSGLFETLFLISGALMFSAFCFDVATNAKNGQP
jgi:hypothetical protein